MVKLKGRQIDINGDMITIWPIDYSNQPYSALYQNKDTKHLDQLFCLDGTKIVTNSFRDKNLEKSVEHTTLGDTHTEYVLRYLVRKAKAANYFVGLKEDEFRDQIIKGKDLGGIYQLRAKHLEQALNHLDWVEQDGVVKRLSYLTRINVEGYEVLFPKNLRRLEPRLFS
jgi:hypothetical protein